jgi:hypothetical protein
MQAVKLSLVVASVAPLLACGGGWTEADTRSATDAVHAEQLAVEACSGDAGCPAGQVRALQTGALASNCSMLFHHGQSVPDAGASCHP